MATSVANKFDYDLVQKLTFQLLEAIGEDPAREGLRDTPRRVADFWREFMEYDAGNSDTVFETVQADQMVVVKEMRVWSLCEHHLLPFYCDISVGYITNEKVLGLSKFARIAQKHAHGLQLQEKLVNDIANEIMKTTGTDHVAVIAKGEHLCMTARGIKMPALMISSALHGSFKQDATTRAEFMALVNA